MAKKWIILAVIVIAFCAIFSGESFIRSKGMILASISGNFGIADEVGYLKEKNQKLELEIFNLKKDNLKPFPDGLGAKVFSAYPFCNRSEVAINLGSEGGAEPGMAVINGAVLVGRVKDCGKEVSVVTTVFDGDFKLPVRVGEHEVDALYIGGLNPKLELIDQSEDVSVGDLVVSASPDFPYGLGVARVVKIVGSTIKEASVVPLFEVKDLRNVSVIAH